MEEEIEFDDNYIRRQSEKKIYDTFKSCIQRMQEVFFITPDSIELYIDRVDILRDFIHVIDEFQSKRYSGKRIKNITNQIIREQEEQAEQEIQEDKLFEGQGVKDEYVYDGFVVNDDETEKVNDPLSFAEEIIRLRKKLKHSKNVYKSKRIKRKIDDYLKKMKY